MEPAVTVLCGAGCDCTVVDGTSGASPFYALDDYTFLDIPLGAFPGDPLAVAVPSPGVAVPRVADTGDVGRAESRDAGVSAVDSGIGATHSGSESDCHSVAAGTMPGSEPSKVKGQSSSDQT